MSKASESPVSAFLGFANKSSPNIKQKTSASAETLFDSKKRKTSESNVESKKAKKKHVRLADILPGKLSTKLITSIQNKNSSSTKQLLSSKDMRKINKTRESKKKTKNTLLNGNSMAISKSVSKAAKKGSKAKALPKNQNSNSSIKTSVNDLLVEPKKDFSTPDSTESTKEEVNSDMIRVQPKKRKDTSAGKSEAQAALPKSKKVKKSLVDQCPAAESEQPTTTITKYLTNNPVEEGKSLFQWLIHPLSIEDFFKNNWERAPLHVNRSKSNYYRLLMSTPMLDSILRDFYILYSKNIDITSYSNGQRETHNPPGRALPSVVWDYYANGCSVRMVNPQTFIPKLHALNATLQEFFGCFVGANSYLTPPDSQGFAPHYDDIEAFILQVEGKKRWRLYKPTTDSEYLPRFSSKNYEPSEIGEPILDTVVNAGDLLYFPRGTIHQGETIDGTHSLHITLSVYQKNSWCDFLEKLIPEALRTAIGRDSRFREGLPIDYLRHVGHVHSSDKSEVRQNFTDKTKELLHRLIDHIDIDKAADQMAKNNIHDYLPPILAPEEQECSVLQDGERMTTGGLVENRVEIEPDTRIRLLRSHCIRLVDSEDCMRIYYSTENSKEYHEYEPQFLDVTTELAPAVEAIIRCYPDFVRVDDLPIEGEDNKVQVARDLWEKCIIVTDGPLPVVE